MPPLKAAQASATARTPSDFARHPGANGGGVESLRGSQDRSTTRRCMHLSLAAPDAALWLLDGPALDVTGGLAVEAAAIETARAARFA
jgi:hypothetical protein